MQSMQHLTPIGRDIDILLFDAFSNHCLANTVEPLRAANTFLRSDHYRWRILTLDGASVKSSSGLRIAPDGGLKDGTGSTLIVMPSYGFRDLAGWRVVGPIKAAARRYETLAGFDTGSWLLAAAGLLDGHKATIHWEEFTSFAEAFPQVEACRERYVIDKARVTCSGAMAAFDLIMHVIGKTHGPLLAMEVGQLFMTEGSAGSTSIIQGPMGRTVRQAISIMQENLESPLSIRAVANRIGVSQRLLEQRTRNDLKATPQGVNRLLRRVAARKRVKESTSSVAERD